MLEAVEAHLRTLNRYPDPERTALRRRLSERTGVPAGRITIGNGSCEILLAAAEAMLEPGAELVYAWPSFSMYPQLAAMSGARAATVPLNDAGEHDLDAMAREVTAATRIVIVCNPNNPTATALPPAAIDGFVGELPRHVAVILDEAYVEFSSLQDPDESIALLDRHPNLILLRTFSKVYGLCGLRVGYALGSEEFRLAVDRVRQPFSVNALAQAAATEALNHVDEVERRVEQTAIERMHVEIGAPGARPRDHRQRGELLLGLGRRSRRGRSGGRPRGARSDRPRRNGAGQGGLDARDLRHPPRERSLPRGAGSAALDLLQRIVMSRMATPTSCTSATPRSARRALSLPSIDLTRRPATAQAVPSFVDRRTPLRIVVPQTNFERL